MGSDHRHQRKVICPWSVLCGAVAVSLWLVMLTSGALGKSPIGMKGKGCHPSPKYPIRVRSKHCMRSRASNEWTKHFTPNVASPRRLNCSKHGGHGVRECLQPVLVRWMLALFAANHNKGSGYMVNWWWFAAIQKEIIETSKIYECADRFLGKLIWHFVHHTPVHLWGAGSCWKACCCR